MKSKWYDASASEAAFLLGGIGTGNFSIGSRGEMRDWEIFNNPGKENIIPFTFFTIRAKPESEKNKAFISVLESKLNPPYSKSHGFGSFECAGLPRMDSSKMCGEYPFVKVEFIDDKSPVKVSLEAFTPLIPLNSNDSGIPGAVLRYETINNSDEKVDVTIAGSLGNMCGFKGYDSIFGSPKFAGKPYNEFLEKNGYRGLFFYSSDLDENHLDNGTMSLMTKDKSVTYKERWSGANFAGGNEFWQDLYEDGLLENNADADKENENLLVGSMAISHRLKPGEAKVFEFIITWHFPNRIKSWNETNTATASIEGRIIKNYYSTLFTDSRDAGKYLLDNLNELESNTRSFHDALFSSTYPDYVIDALASNITALRSTTCFRIEDGTFLGWEGCWDQKGCCAGNCTHVWNYAQTVAFLFPDLEQSMRRIEFDLETDIDGNMAFRTYQVLGDDRFKFHSAVDGQMGTIVRLYREWKLSGKNSLIKDLWEKAAKALDYAFTFWDSDGDDVLDSQQHNTYDIEFFGQNSLGNSMFFAALKAGAEMAEFMSDAVHAKKYKKALNKGSSKMDSLLWNGEYYTQNTDGFEEKPYQYGKGCLSDQVFGQLLAHICGLGYILPEDHVKKAIYSVYKYNFCKDLSEHVSFQRTYALNDESGLLLCTWPKGGRPEIPFIYCDEVWTGIEYQVAAHLIYEGFIKEGLSLVEAVRERHDGYKRNPWNEVECGNHYARSMASWGVLIALSGFDYDMVNGIMAFNPAINADNFSTFWSTGKAWGVYTQQVNSQTGEIEREIDILYGSLDGVKIKGPCR